MPDCILIKCFKMPEQTRFRTRTISLSKTDFETKFVFCRFQMESYLRRVGHPNVDPVATQRSQSKLSSQLDGCSAVQRKSTRIRETSQSLRRAKLVRRLTVDVTIVTGVNNATGNINYKQRHLSVPSTIIIKLASLKVQWGPKNRTFQYRPFYIYKEIFYIKRSMLIEPFDIQPSKCLDFECPVSDPHCTLIFFAAFSYSILRV